METKVCTTERHVRLDKAISYMNMANRRAEAILNRIQGNDSVEPALAPTSTESLQSVLDNGPDRIRTTADELVITLEKIEDALF